MMRSALGDAARLADFETVKRRMLGSQYTMNFDNGLVFDLDVLTSGHHYGGDAFLSDQGGRAVSQDERQRS